MNQISRFCPENCTSLKPAVENPLFKTYTMCKRYKRRLGYFGTYKLHKCTD